MLKTILFSLIICLGFGLFTFVYSQEETTTVPEVTIDETVTSQDLEITEPTTLPDSPVYFLKEWTRGIRSFFTFNKIKKAELESRFSNERLIEIKKMIEKNKDPELIRKATEKYEISLDKIKQRVEKIEEKAEDNPKVEKFLEKYTNHQILHQKILDKLEEQVPEQVFEKIEQTRQRHLEKFKDVMLKLEEKTKIGERLEKTLEEQEGSDFKEFKNLEILKRIREKMPEQAKEKIMEAETNILERLKIKVEGMSEKNQEKFENYIDKISGDKEEQLEILENLRLRFEERSQIQERLNQVRQEIVEKIPEQVRQRIRNCAQIEKPDLDSCPNGRIIADKDENGCIIEFRCVSPQTSNENTQQACISLWDPVCGVDGKTYSNTCFARIANVEIDYKGECGQQCKQDSDCPQFKCGSTGVAPEAKCIGARSKCLNGRCIIIYDTNTR